MLLFSLLFFATFRRDGYPRGMGYDGSGYRHFLRLTDVRSPPGRRRRVLQGVMITEAEGYAQPPRFPRTNGLQLLSNLEEFSFHCKPHPLRVRHTDRSVARGVWRLRACGVWRALRACVVCGGPLWVSQLQGAQLPPQAPHAGGKTRTS